jgi:hypothetical protein
MPTDIHSQWRFELAQDISQELRKFTGIQAIMVGGSVARGYADEYSDLELALFWDDVPSDRTRLDIAAALGANFLHTYNGPALEDNLLIHGFQVDFWHNTVSSEDFVIDSVLTNFSTDLGSSNFMDTIRAGIPIYGTEIIERWKARAASYPVELATRTIQQALDRIHVTHLAIVAHRQNATLLYGLISELQQQVFLILLALNRRYFPTYKWVYPVLESLPIKPHDAAGRYQQAYTAGPAVAAADTVAILEETLDLVHEQFPSLDIESVRRRVKVTRQAHTQPLRLR